ncbi:MAG: pyridoxal phosphate-dependent aminotransferase [Thermoleophilaceae bacterium]
MAEAAREPDGAPPSPAPEPTPPAMTELRIAARTAYPEGLIDLSRSEPLPVPVADACAERMQEEFMRARLYSPPGGLMPTREAVARHVSARTGLEIGADRVAIAAGAMHGISISLRALVEPGAEVLVPVPYFHAHPQQVSMLGATPRFVDTRPLQGVLTPEAVERELTSRTRALVLCNPSNPAGVVLSRAELEAIFAVLPPHVAVIGDEVYAEYLYDGRLASMLEVAEREASAPAPGAPDGREVVIVSTASKTAGMPGWRVGSAVGTPGLAPRLAQAAATMSGAPSTPAQLAYAAWLDDPPEIDRMAPYRPRLRDVLEALADTGAEVREPQGTYYVWATAPSSAADSRPSENGAAAPAFGSAEGVLAVARETGVLVWPGILFGDPESVRISLSVPRRDLRKGVSKLTDPWREVWSRDIPVSRPRG